MMGTESKSGTDGQTDGQKIPFIELQNMGTQRKKNFDHIRFIDHLSFEALFPTCEMFISLNGDVDSPLIIGPMTPHQS